MCHKKEKMADWKTRGKEVSPTDTIKRIRGILKQYGIETEIIDYDSEVDGCCSCRLNVMGKDGPVFGTNGKGSTPELSHASAYGELMERLSNRLFGQKRNILYYDMTSLKKKIKFQYDVYSENQPAAVMDFKKRVAASMSFQMPEHLRLLYVDKALENMSLEGSKGKFPASEFYSLKEERMIEIPLFMQKIVGSNGMAAGNTIEEALVEGMSELIERYCQVRIMEGIIIPPEIPRKYIEEHAPDVMKTISRIEENDLYAVHILDCSLGKKLPAVCGIIIEKNTGHFCVKFGAHPFFEVALERVFTEALQGSGLREAVHKNTPDFMAGRRDNREERYNLIKFGKGTIAAQLLLQGGDYAFAPWESAESTSNRELCVFLAEKLKSLSTDILVRDASIMGFPAVFIYVPGVSEAPEKADMVTLTRYELQKKVLRHFTNLSNLSKEDVQDIKKLADIKKNIEGEKTVSAISGIAFNGHMHGYPYELGFLVAVCNHVLGNDEKALRYLRTILADVGFMEPDEAAFVRCTYDYIRGIAAETEPKHLHQIIETLYPDACREVFYCLDDKRHALERLYPMFAETKGKGCSTPEIFSLMDALDKAEAENPANYDTIKEIFAGSL